MASCDRNGHYMLHRHLRAVHYCCPALVKQSNYDLVTSSKATTPSAEVIATTRVSPATRLVSQCRLVPL